MTGAVPWAEEGTLARLLYLATAGPDEPARAALPLVLALGAVEGGHRAEVCYVGEAAPLLTDDVARAVQPSGWPRLEELLATAVTDGVLLHVCQRGERTGGVAEQDLLAKNARFITLRGLADLMLDVDRVITI